MAESSPASEFERRPALWLAASFAAGIVSASLVSIDIRVAMPAAITLAIAAVVFRGRHAAGFLVLAAFAAAGAATYSFEQTSVAEDRIKALYDNGAVRSGDPVEVEGLLLGGTEPAVDGLFLDLRAERLLYHGSERTVSGRVRLYLPQARDAPSDGREIDGMGLRYGSRIRVACRLEREDAFLNPGVIGKTEILDRAGIDATATIKSPLMIEPVADESVFVPLAWVYDQRVRLIADINRGMDQSAAGIMIASLLGDKYFLDKQTGDLFREGGTFHILVISGLHITFIGWLLLLAARQFTKNRWTLFIVPAAILWAYTLAVGADLPVVRAAVMFTVISFSYVIYRQTTLLNSLGVCALLLLAWRPSELFNPSLQLTFVSVGAILGMAYPLIESLRKIGKWMPTADEPLPPNVPGWLRRFCEMLYWNEDAWKIELDRQVWSTRLFKSPFLPRRVNGAMRTAVRYLFEGFLVSLIVQIWMLPLVVVYFHRISAASVILNLWVGFFIAAESFAAVAAVLLGRFSETAAAPIFALAEVLNWLMLLAPRLFVDGGWASFRLPAYSGDGRFIYVLYLLPVLFLAWIVNGWDPFEVRSQFFTLRRRVLYGAFAALAVFAGVIVLHPVSAPRPDGRLHIDFLDVGQGDAALVTFPDGKTMLVDGGGRFRYGSRDNEDADTFEPDIRGIGEAVVSEFLWNRGYGHVDALVATHADVDHIQGLSDVAANFNVDRAILGRVPIADADVSELLTVLKRRRVPVEIAASGDKIRFGSVTVDVLYPPPTDDPNAVSDNDHSVVLRIVYGDRSILLTGDIERRAEADLVASGFPLTADLVKVAHHGSRTSSTQEFINAVNARHAVISVGRSSPFGHPHRDVVERWRSSGAGVMTTGDKGTISVSTNGTDLVIETFQP